ncbi:glucosamine 6-phosphate acetyltransferase protein [Rutstroemia sp. NJR-2017a BBW]|nr:glucosamine 6-phosphate acetyltransferase protein [Rutstroemia sp. NJR-2017a BBW]
MASESSLFSNSLISSESNASLPEGYSFRALQRSDFSRGHVTVLKDLAYVGNVTEEQWIERFDAMKKREDTYFVLVIVKKTESGDVIIGTGTLVVELKFLGGLGVQGHVEDIAIAKDYHGMKFGMKLIKALDHIAAELGCYKSILDCAERTKGFYQKCGYEAAGLEMHHYHDLDSEAAKHHV